MCHLSSQITEEVKTKYSIEKVDFSITPKLLFSFPIKSDETSIFGDSKMITIALP